MDVADLAPALLALGELIKRANYAVNGDASKVNLIVQSDFEHKCFQVNLELVQSILSTIGSFLTDEHTLKSAQNIAGLLGLIGVPTTAIGLFAYLVRRKGKEVESVTPLAGDETTIATSDSHGTVAVKFKGDGDGNTVVVNQNVYLLGEDPVVRDYAAKVVSPLKRKGIDTLQFNPETPAKGVLITKSDAEAIISGRAQLKETEEETFEPQPIVAHLQISRPDFEPKAHIWRFRYGDRTISVDIGETEIAEQVRARGSVGLADTWRVRMLVTEKRTTGGNYKNEYKIAEVLEFIPAPRQAIFRFISDDEDNANEED
ncbi:hypothetical protein [Bradyrhizobium sp. JYMT SZCCT0428]|uniref:hypothetical protein n=1 Tax=Bradyrhizobium sp. JYMT SZCCT0428 TaxID=2807673 RepID=UPI001BA6F58D|nr:hypothetical protein [Bradyrhizobium sp. JYMT SZCCT0428]MBR1151098.1 hypothetical protein [Bradyrhizobium sp. JYMT SZCCT0428]